MELDNRLRSLRAGTAGTVPPMVWSWMQRFRQMFPGVPDEIVVRTIPTESWRGEDLPWNWRQRKRHAEAKSIVLHLFSGKDQAWWTKRLDEGGRATICVDTLADARQDLKSDAVMAYLLELAEKGAIHAVIGGPPCRTMSKLRFKSPGPPPLRSREGPQRFGLEHLTEWQREQVRGDTVLWLRQLWLYTVARESAQRPVLFLKEHPQDPQEYKDSGDPVDYPSYFAWPEWKTFCRQNAMVEVKLDLGTLGHQRCKLTTLGTNMKGILQLHGRRVKPSGKETQAESLEERIQISRSWAAWPERFKEEIVKALKAELDGPEVRKMTAEQWKQHLACDHQPFSRECATCQRGAGRKKVHRRVPHPDTYTLSVDVCGPFKPGQDQDRKVGRYFMVGVFTLPVTVEAKKVISLAPGLKETLGGGHVLEEEPAGGMETLSPEMEPEERDIQRRGDDLQGLEEWYREEVAEEEGVEVRNFTLLEVLPNRHAPALVEALSRMIAKLKYLGLEVRRVHSDAAGELRSTKKWCHSQGLYRTFTAGSDWMANGRAEAEIGMVRRGINVLMRLPDAEESQWPLMARHVAERRGRLQLKALGFATPTLLPWNSRVAVSTKGWDEFQGHWRPRKRVGRVKGPDISMSMTSGGHYVQLDEGRFVRANDVVDVSPETEAAAVRESEAGVADLEQRARGGGPVDLEGRPSGRLREKTAIRGISIQEAQSRLDRGVLHANTLFKSLETRTEGPEEVWQTAVPVVFDMDRENEELETYIRALRVEEEGEVAAACQAAAEEAQVLQTKTFALNEVKKELPKWIPAMEKEVNSILANQAVQRVPAAEAERYMEEMRKEGYLVERVPGKAVFTQKAGSGRLKARICVCGNLMSERASEDLYASGVDSTQVRTMVRKASLQGWELASLDIQTAFLLAPTSQKELIVMVPPRILVDAGLVAADEVWIITSALYGMTTAPRDWANYRDEQVASWRWTYEEDGVNYEMSLKPLGDQNLWGVFKKGPTEESCEGSAAVYVDDILMGGPKAICDSVIGQIRRVWGDLYAGVRGGRKGYEVPGH